MPFKDPEKRRKYFRRYMAEYAAGKRRADEAAVPEKVVAKRASSRAERDSQPQAAQRAQRRGATMRQQRAAKHAKYKATWEAENLVKRRRRRRVQRRLVAGEMVLELSQRVNDSIKPD